MDKEWTEVRKKTGTVKIYSRVTLDDKECNRQKVREEDTYDVTDDGSKEMWVENFSFLQVPSEFGWFDLNSVRVTSNKPEWIELWIGGSVMAQTREGGRFVKGDHLFIPLCQFHETRIRAAYKEKPDSQSTCSLTARTGTPTNRVDIELDLECPPPNLSSADANIKQVVSFGAGIAARRYNMGPKVVYCD